MKSKQTTLLLFLLLFSATIFGQGKFSVKKEFRADCSGTNKVLQSTEEYDQARKIKSSTQPKRKTEFVYDSNGNLISKIHRDLSGKLLRYNKIYYNENNEYSIDTLFSGDSTASMIFKRRHSKKANEDIITWDNLVQKGSTVIQTIKLDEQKNEIENTVCTSSSECTISKNTYSESKLMKSEIFRREEMNRKPVLIETQIFEYDSSNRLSKITFTNEIDRMCDHTLIYNYE
ncbi:MAG: hypothetical protein IPN61_03125 [Bacteroidetes bacterium]|nr:hypothetical protein [Bacteroidota bacterium]